MAESNLHLELKKMAKDRLKKFGYEKSEIFYEYRVNINGREYIVDVAGISETKGNVAIECGNVQGSVTKIKNLLCYFTEVINIPYDDTYIPKHNKTKNESKKISFRVESYKYDMIVKKYLENKIKYDDMNQFIRYLLFDGLNRLNRLNRLEKGKTIKKKKLMEKYWCCYTCIFRSNKQSDICSTCEMPIGTHYKVND